MSSAQHLLKRVVDLLIGLPLALVSLPIVLLLILLASLSTAQFGLFCQHRIGRHGKGFKLCKIRSLKGSDHLDVREMKRATAPFGKWLRNSKLDELPQLWQVVIGQMSLVGPRPDIPGYADQLQGEDRLILELRPGITGPASIKYKQEDTLLLSQEDPNAYNNEVIWPDKVRINKSYYQNWSLWTDFRYLWQSLI
ncbi:sugar transferase [Aureitalea marina]|uniref:Bacterial sugar transferase domain-containing protein n=1 Tax=Aureitalea marina TaxID=930804 RepID=A0A2S7KML5_9FLAO|nr:sugar transferase [Aureitalea marina]PQB03867.1 hypothetical protein BST85_02310 [Aureitalea marina]